MADTFMALSSATRRSILGMLKKQDMTAGEIADILQISKSTLSGHFNVLKNANLVETERSGTTITYSLKTSVVEDMMSELMSLFAVDKNGD
ncbi:MAG: winged helix-turn-helix transcriptional regulator [Rhizobiales bacterium]|nr:autorepressor SdpR family transcription factor [Hyphomicrobiales bacterium]NRB14793.1 winged helix-turn-helix transcriptional regulator [Hyphomicrobiales bacterium]